LFQTCIPMKVWDGSTKKVWNFLVDNSELTV
jgi:hypothetical protein